jgi:flagellin
MAILINTNILSLTAQRNVASNEASLGTAIERLSTGLRINSAKDDAAGLAISERFTSQIRGQTIAERNANDAISFSQVAEGALGVISNALQRIRELAVQSLNDSNTAENRASINEEVQQLVEEVARVADGTTFNGRSILDGSIGTLNFQVGAERGQTLGISGVNATASELKNVFKVAEGTVDLVNSFPTGLADLTLKGGAPGSEVVTFDLSDASDADDVVQIINDKMSDTGIQASLNTDGELELADASGNSFTIGGTAATITALGLDNGATPPVQVAQTDDERAVADISVTTRDGANSALAVLDTAIDQVTSMRANLGAIQNRLENVVEVLSTSRENLSEARSRIRDADYAAETANLTRAQILQQAGLSSLAQANAAPQSVLSLLQ